MKDTTDLYNSHAHLDKPFEAESEYLYQKKIEELQNELAETHARVHELNEEIAELKMIFNQLIERLKEVK